MANNNPQSSKSESETNTKRNWEKFLEKNKWTTYLANELKSDSSDPKKTLLKYEALLTQCSYLSRMAYCPADIFCRMTQHLDVTPNAFNNYIRAIEKIYDKLFNYKCSFDSRYIQEHQEFSKYFNPVGDILASQTNAKQVGINASKMNAKQVGIEVLQNNTDKPSMVKLRDRIKLLKNSSGKNNKNNSALSKLASKLIGEISTEANSTVNVFTLKELLDELYYIYHTKNKKEAQTEFEKIKVKYDKLIQNTPKNSLPNPYPPLSKKNNSQSGGFTNKPIGFFVQNKEHMNVYLYFHHNPKSEFNTKKTLFIAFKGSSSIEDFKHDLKSAAFPDQLLSELNYAQNKQQVISNAKNKNKPGKAGYGFIKSLKPSITKICEKIQELKEFERVIITGHSLGGALASLFGYYLKKYNPNLIDKPIHVITFGACCVFDAVGRNEFNEFLNIEGEKKDIFTLDRVTSNLDPIIVLPADLDHPGFTIPRGEIKSYTRTHRTKEIGEIRDMFGLKIEKTILTADDLLSTENFVKLFSNYNALKVSDTYDEELYKKKFKINFGTKAEEQYPILDIAMPDAKLPEIQELFNKIEKIKTKFGNIPKDEKPKQKGGLYNPLLKGSNATKAYKKQAEIRMPNQIQYSCYAQITMSFCHACYLGVSYVMVLRLPNISEGKLRKEPTKDYTLYQKNERIFSSAPGNYNSNSDCSKVESNNPTNKTKNINSTENSNKSKKNSSKKGSLMNRFTGFTGLFKTKNSKKKNLNNKSTSYTQLTQMNTTTNSGSNNLGTSPEDISSEEENQGGVFSNCSIL